VTLPCAHCQKKKRDPGSSRDDGNETNFDSAKLERRFGDHPPGHTGKGRLDHHPGGAAAGFGQLVGQLMLLVQNSAPRHQLGVATTAVRFFQTLGNALGTAVFGSVLARLYAAHGPGGDITALARLTGASRAEGVRAFVDATQAVFWGGAALMALAALLALRLPRSGGAKDPSAPPRESEPVPA